MMILLWTLLGLIGFVVAVWYLRATVLNPYGGLPGGVGAPMILRGCFGHLVAWALIGLGAFGAFKCSGEL